MLLYYFVDKDKLLTGLHMGIFSGHFRSAEGVFEPLSGECRLKYHLVGGSRLSRTRRCRPARVPANIGLK